MLIKIDSKDVLIWFHVAMGKCLGGAHVSDVSKDIKFYDKNGEEVIVAEARLTNCSY